MGLSVTRRWTDDHYEHSHHLVTCRADVPFYVVVWCQGVGMSGRGKLANNNSLNIPPCLSEVYANEISRR